MQLFLAKCRSVKKIDTFLRKAAIFKAKLHQTTRCERENTGVQHAQNPFFAVQANRAGALGYVTKSSPPEVLLRAIHEVYSGRHTLSADIVKALALEKLGTERSAVETFAYQISVF